MVENHIYCPHQEHVQKNGPGRVIPTNDGRIVLLCRACNLKFLLFGEVAWSTDRDESQRAPANG